MLLIMITNVAVAAADAATTTTTTTTTTTNTTATNTTVACQSLHFYCKGISIVLVLAVCRISRWRRQRFLKNTLFISN
jgi:hypothetical protein